MTYKDHQKYLDYQRKYHQRIYDEEKLTRPDGITVRGTVRKNALAQHTLTAIDTAERQADCAKCGRITIVRNGPRWRCQQANISARRISILKSKYGLTMEQYDQLLAAQDNACAVCKNKFDKLWPCIDHDHQTMQIRGILCVKCNTGIGNLGDGSLLEAALLYIQKIST